MYTFRMCIDTEVMTIDVILLIKGG